MNNRIRISIVVVTALTWLVAALIFGLPTTLVDAARPFIAAMTVASVTFVAYDHFLWRLPLIRRFVAGTPDLLGVWRGEIHTTWTDPETGKRKDPIRGFVQIDQSASKFCMRVFTEESRSKTVAFSFADDQGVFRLAIVYENQPDIHLREKKSAFHQGSASFHVRGYRPAMFNGEYWTERKNVGTITVSERRRGEIDSYEQGLKLYDS